MVWRTCMTCRGQKFVIRKGLKVTCPACDGKGGSDSKTTP